MTTQELLHKLQKYHPKLQELHEEQLFDWEPLCPEHDWFEVEDDIGIAAVECSKCNALGAVYEHGELIWPIT
jgi:formylmethanofuran dehydrogenase subunit E